MDIQSIVQNQRLFFATNQSKEVSKRKEALRKIKEVIQKNEMAFYEAIHKDFGKSKFDTYTTELSLIYHEIDYYLKNLNKLSKPKKVKTSLANLPGSSEVQPEPFGVCLVIGAWNYPYQLSISPVVGAIAAGNTVILKPSELSAETSAIMTKAINENFNANYVHVVEGGIPETTQLLNERFDKIFFTGSPNVGKIIYQAAAKYLTPVTLELGGKSPVIVTESANFETAAKRITWGKFLNAGQTCIAPDYMLIDEKIASAFLEKLKATIQKFGYQKGSQEFPFIINEKNFDRLIGLVDNNKIYFGGENDRESRYIAPTIQYPASWEDKIMQEEIFGPILPVLTYKSFDEALNKIQAREKPLSAYLFSGKKLEQNQFKKQLSFGGGCINDTIMHISNSHLPFGGVGNSGIGNYHGKYGFETFSHSKAILKKANWGEPNVKYPPYSEKKLSWIKKLI